MNIWLIAAMSVNGKIAQDRDQNSLDWTSKEDTAFFVQKTKEAKTVVMGQKTFETIGRPLKGRRLIVLTPDESLKEKNMDEDENGTRLEFVNETPTELVSRLKSEGVETLVIGGGSFVYSSFLRERLVTDVFLTIEPIIFGSGIPLAEMFGDVELELVETTMLNTQTICLHYRVK